MRSGLCVLPMHTPVSHQQALDDSIALRSVMSCTAERLSLGVIDYTVALRSRWMERQARLRSEPLRRAEKDRIARSAHPLLITGSTSISHLHPPDGGVCIAQIYRCFESLRAA